MPGNPGGPEHKDLKRTNTQIYISALTMLKVFSMAAHYECIVLCDLSGKGSNIKWVRRMLFLQHSLSTVNEIAFGHTQGDSDSDPMSVSSEIGGIC